MRLVALLLILVGCSEKRRDPTGSGSAQPAVIVAPHEGGLSADEANRFATLTDRLAGVVALHKSDCAAMAKGLQTVLDGNRETLKLGAEARAAGKQLPEPVLARIQTRIQEMANDLKPCLSDPAVQAAFARYRGEPVKTKPEMPAADAARIVAFVDKVGEAIKASRGNCEKMAAMINRVIDANADVMKVASDAQAAGKELPASVHQELVARIQALSPIMVKCVDDKAVSLAFGRLQLGGT